VTGLHPESHGIIANYFRSAANTSDQFSMANHEARWWLGEPMWVTAAKQGLTAAAYFWYALCLILILNVSLFCCGESWKIVVGMKSAQPNTA
jgi:hypothetical protein